MMAEMFVSEPSLGKREPEIFFTKEFKFWKGGCCG
jgi:hypothetical protein